MNNEKRPQIQIEPKVPALPTPTAQSVRQAAQGSSAIHTPDLRDALANIYAFILKRKAERQR